MSERLFLVESDEKGLRAALIEDRHLQAVEIDRAARPTRVGSVGQAKIVRTAKGIGTFVRLADGTEMLLDAGRGKQHIEAGQTAIVQVRHEPRGGKLGVAARSVAIAGHGVVHLPFESGVHLSRRLEIEAERQAGLETLVAGKPGGWVFRRSAPSINTEDFSSEIKALLEDSKSISESGLTAPDAFRRLASDHGSPAPDRIYVAGLAARRSAEHWCTRFAPSLSARIAIAEPGLFDHYDLDDAIASLTRKDAPLPGGGWLSIEPTEALTAIDVNAGPEPNLLAANLAAAAEIALQLRLRHIGGLVAIDFISMNRPADRERTVAALKSAVADDPAQTHILPMSAFGIVEMTRERRGPGLEFDD